MTKLIIGIDIGKQYHQTTVIDESGKMMGGSIRFSNYIAGVELLRLCSFPQTKVADADI